MGGLGLEIGATLGAGLRLRTALSTAAIKNLFLVKNFHLSTSSSVKWSLSL